MLQVYQGGFAARATSSDLAAAQALAELRHEDDIMDTDSMESGEEEGEEAEYRGGSSGAGYDRGFRVTAPPLPLWLPGTPSLIPYLFLTHSFSPNCSDPFTIQAVTHPCAYLRLYNHALVHTSICTCACSVTHPFIHPPLHPLNISISFNHLCFLPVRLVSPDQILGWDRQLPQCAFRLARLLYVCIHHRSAMLLYQGLQLQHM